MGSLKKMIVFFLLVLNLVLSAQENVQIQGGIVLQEAGTDPDTGSIQWNSSTLDFEGFDGDQWVSLTKNGSVTKYGSPNVFYPKEIIEPFATSDYNASRSFGYSSVHNNQLMLVADQTGTKNGTNYMGLVYTYVRSGNTWAPAEVLADLTTTTFTGYGGSVALIGDVAIVGAPIYRDGPNLGVGQLKVYQFQGTWTELLTIDAPINTPGASFGDDILIHNNYLIVGAKGTNNKGAVYIFNLNSLALEQTLEPSNLNVGDQFGRVFSVHGEHLAIGSARNEIHIYQLDNNGAYQLELILDGANYNIDVSNKPFSLSKNTLTIGLRDFESNGAVMVFKRINNIWLRTQTIREVDPMASNRFGEHLMFDGLDLYVYSRKEIYGFIRHGIVYKYRNIDGKFKVQNAYGVTDPSAGITLGFRMNAGMSNLALYADGKNRLYLY